LSCEECVERKTKVRSCSCIRGFLSLVLMGKCVMTPGWART
jgi:hypothetical protein